LQEESKGEQKQKLKILFQYGQERDSKTALDDFATGYLVNNGINEGPSGTKKSTIIYLVVLSLEDMCLM
jgi:hypothetical protein